MMLFVRHFDLKYHLVLQVYFYLPPHFQVLTPPNPGVHYLVFSTWHHCSALPSNTWTGVKTGVKMVHVKH